MPNSVKKTYEAELAARGYTADPAQLRAVEALERCAKEWAVYKGKRSNAFKKLINRPEIPRGVYMYGGVGRGKSFLMDCFFNAVPLKRKTRLHFHEFMREVHRELSDLQGTVNPLDELARRMSLRYKLVLSAEVEPELLYTEGPMSHEFPRTVSRLNEMQSKEYLALERRMVDTGLT